MKFTYSKTNNSLAFSVFTMLCNHHLYLIIKHLYHFKGDQTHQAVTLLKILLKFIFPCCRE